MLIRAASARIRHQSYDRLFGAAVLTIADALERTRGFGPVGQVPLTRNEIDRVGSDGFKIPQEKP